MTSKRRFYRHVYSVEVLSEEPLPENIDLDSLHYQITEGECSGIRLGMTTETVDGPTMAKLLQGQGSDPEFFSLDADGNDVED